MCSDGCQLQSGGNQLALVLFTARIAREAHMCLKVSLSFQNAVRCRPVISHKIMCKTNQIVSYYVERSLRRGFFVEVQVLCGSKSSKTEERTRPYVLEPYTMWLKLKSFWTLVIGYGPNDCRNIKIYKIDCTSNRHKNTSNWKKRPSWFQHIVQRDWVPFCPNYRTDQIFFCRTFFFPSV